MKPKKWTKEKVLDFLRAKEKELGRTPGVKDVPKYVLKVSVEHFESWDKALIAATGKPGARHRKFKEEIAGMLRTIETKNNRLPEGNDVDPRTVKLISEYYGSFDAALETLFLKSHRTVILSALQVLTPTQCPKASSREVAQRLNNEGYNYTIANVGSRLVDYKNEGYVSGGKVDREALWNLTATGKQFVKEHGLEKK